MSGKRGGKFSKPARGGGKKFSRNLKPLEDDVDEKPGMWDMDEPKDTAAGSDEGSGDEAENSAITREERKALQKARKEAAKAKAAATKTTDSGDDDDDEDEEKDDGQPPLVNPNLTPGNPNAPGRVGAGGISRREREAKEAAAAKERYMKLHAQGKTDEAKADLARLAVIRKEREEKAKQRQAELDEKKRLAEEKATVQGRKK